VDLVVSVVGCPYIDKGTSMINSPIYQCPHFETRGSQLLQNAQQFLKTASSQNEDFPPWSAHSSTYRSPSGASINT
jgi:hypothetical protein